ncbi:MAG: hypothetical protein HOK21_10415 [Rhodospirillaceae bacterium]|jgi:hypothetical protein|nr:hypothetical protein [Rhodospirillaceae bacterium]MBT4041996.1 hypothetical protein [Rhodospirillaceae bacterium]MBT4688557.1 hypothetical protein [Rhodospirillaceae bacterium]MBT5083048.1 hypothetical protein [Rhodospirillaceae bacterium]MBT5524492.1 hypothetical protein [Rhodospirillaceae bacterium]
MVQQNTAENAAQNPAQNTAAKVRYVNAEWRDRDETPRIGSRETRRANTSFQDTMVYDARPRLAAGELDLASSGFTLAKNQTAVTDFRDDAQVAAKYYGEMEALVCRATGADRAIAKSHLVRTETPIDFNDGYSRFVHCDYNMARIEDLTEELFEREGIVAQDNWTYAWYNTWQPFDHAVVNNPLAVIDWQSLPMADVIGYFYTGRGRDSLVAAPVHNPEHKFWYFPEMQTDEVLLFTQLNQQQGQAIYCPHTSFDVPGVADDAPPRRSVETRLLAIFESKN